MKIKILDRKKFLKGLKTALICCGKKDSGLDLLSLIAENYLQLKATDLKIAITYNLSVEYVKVLESGELLIPAARLYNLVKEIKDPELTLSLIHI